MPAISTNDLKNGITLELDNGLFQVMEFQHVKPGKGGAFVRSKLRNLRTGSVLERTFNAGIRVEQALLDKKDMQFLYRDGDEYVFMDTESYEQQNVAPTALQQEVYDVVLAAQRAGVAAVRPGVATSELDGVCRDLITCAGFGEWFIHGTGHGVGLLIHEDPFVNATGRDELQLGDVVTVEPGVYRGDFGGVRVEDLVLVTSTGGRVLTSSPKDSPCLPSAPTT